MQAWAKQRQMKVDRHRALEREEAAYMARAASCAAVVAKLQEARDADAKYKRRLLRWSTQASSSQVT